jgi:hypothetical protein
MRIPFRRLLLVGGGAAVLATAGFAYMASNTVPITSAGQASAAVTGYTVTNVTYNGGSGDNCGGTCYIGTVGFTLTADNANSQNNGKPVFVYVDVEGSNNGEIANADGCTVPAGTLVGATGQWTGNFTCTLNPNTATVAEVDFLDIAATQ